MASTSALCRAWDMCHFLYLSRHFHQLKDDMMTTEEEFKEHLRAKRYASMEDDIDALKDQVYELEDLLHNHLSPPLAYDSEFGDERICECGHPYYRHFDTYDHMAPVGCKYCDCREFKEQWEGDVRAAVPYPADPGAKVHKDIGIGRAANSKSKKPSTVEIESFVTFTSNGPVYGKIALITGCSVHYDAKLGGYVVEGGLPSWKEHHTLYPDDGWGTATPECMVDDYSNEHPVEEPDVSRRNGTAWQAQIIDRQYTEIKRLREERAAPGLILTTEIAKLRAQVNRLTRERDNWKEQADSLAARKDALRAKGVDR